MTTHARRGQKKTAYVILGALALVTAACGSDNNSSSGTAASGSTASTAAATATTAAATATTAAATATTAAATATTAAATADPLGTPNKATGTPIKIGVVNDGKTDAIDNSSSLDTIKAVAQYANDYLGGLNGQPIEIDGCETKNTPSGGTTCGVQMVNDKVAAVLVGGLAQDAAVFAALADSGIPYITASSAVGDILTKPGAFVFTNPIGTIAAPIPRAQANGVDKVGFVVIDVPAATGPITQIATPFYKNANIGLDMIPISPTVADMTPQIQQAIGNGDGLFTLAGTESFNAGAIKALRQLGFTGDIMGGFNNTSPETVASVPGGYEGIINLSSTTDDPTDPDVVLYKAILDKYAKGTTEDISSQNGFIASMGMLRSLTGATSAVDAASISAAMSAVPAPVALPLGGGITIQCGAKLVVFAPNICTTEILESTLDANAKGTKHEVVNVADFIKLG